jgi:hypothetical protein
MEGEGEGGLSEVILARTVNKQALAKRKSVYLQKATTLKSPVIVYKAKRIEKTDCAKFANKPVMHDIKVTRVVNDLS